MDAVVSPLSLKNTSIGEFAEATTVSDIVLEVALEYISVGEQNLSKAVLKTFRNLPVVDVRCDVSKGFLCFSLEVQPWPWYFLRNVFIFGEINVYIVNRSDLLGTKLILACVKIGGAN